MQPPIDEPLDAFNWRPFLQKWSRELIEAAQIGDITLPAEVIASDWVGQPGATDSQLAVLEARLGRALPPAFRQFLTITNGWKVAAYGIQLDVWDTERIEWFCTSNQEWIDLWEQGYYDGTSADEEVPDILRSMRIALQIGTGQDSRVYWLDPQAINTADEWEAWEFASWMVDEDVYDSFWDLLHAIYLDFRENRTHEFNKRYHPNDDLAALRRKLLRLNTDLTVAAQTFATPLYRAEYQRAVLQTLHRVARQVRSLREQPLDLEATLAALGALAEATAAEQANLPTIQDVEARHIFITRLDDAEQSPLFEALGTRDGLIRATTIIRWFVRLPNP